MATVIKEDFITYEKIRRSGATNMLEIDNVQKLSDAHGNRLTEDQIRDIIKNYSEYEDKWGDEL